MKLICRLLNLLLYMCARVLEHFTAYVLVCKRIPFAKLIHEKRRLAFFQYHFVKQSHKLFLLLKVEALTHSLSDNDYHFRIHDNYSHYGCQCIYSFDLHRLPALSA